MGNFYILDRNEKAVGVLNNELPNACPFFDDVHTERLEHAFATLEFSVPGNHPTSALLETEGFIVYPNLDGDLELFRIKQVTDSHSDGQLIKKVFCEAAYVSDLLANIIEPVTLNSQTLEQAMTYILQNTGWELGKVEYDGVQTFEWKDYPTALAALHDVMDKFGTELEFRVEFKGLRITKKYVNALIQRGTVTGKLFTYGIDLAEVERTEDTTNLVTALYGIGKADSNGNEMTFANYTPPADPKYEKSGKWVGSLEALDRWGKNGKHIFGVYKDENAQNPIELFNNTKKELDRLSKPQLTYKVGVVLLERLTGYEAHRVRLGDTIVVKDTVFNPPLALEARVIERKTSKSDPSSDSVVLGDYKPITITPIKELQRLQSTIRLNQEKWNQAQYAGGTGSHVVVNSPAVLLDSGYQDINPDPAISEYAVGTYPGDYSSKYMIRAFNGSTVTTHNNNNGILYFSGNKAANADIRPYTPTMTFNKAKAYNIKYQVRVTVSPANNKGSLNIYGAVVDNKTNSEFNLEPYRIRTTTLSDGWEEREYYIPPNTFTGSGTTGRLALFFSWSASGTQTVEWKSVQVVPIPTIISTDGDFANLGHSLTIQVTDSVHLGYATIYTDTPNQTGTIELRDANDNVIQSKSVTLPNAGENRVQLDFLLNPEVGTYKLYGSFSGNTYRTKNGVTFPYDSGTFKVVGTSSPNGYWYHFYNIEAGGAGVRGAYGQDLLLGDNNNRLGTLTLLDSQGETAITIDNDHVGIDKLVVGQIISPSVVNYWNQNITIYVNPSTGSDDIDLDDAVAGSKFKTIQRAIDTIPKNNDGVINIKLEGNTIEGIDINGFFGVGTIDIDLQTYSVDGYIKCSGNTNYINIHNGTIYNKDAPENNYATVWMQRTSHSQLENLTVYSRNTAQYNINISDGGHCFIRGCAGYGASGAQSTVIRAAYGAMVDVEDCKGQAMYGIWANYSALVGGKGKKPDGTSQDILELYGGKAFGTWDTNPDPGSAGTPPAVKTTGVWNSVSGESYRSTVYTGWQNNDDVRQGQWGGYGLNWGFWFFGTGPSTAVTGKTISRIRVYLTRLSKGGVTSSQTVYIRYHTYTTQPGSAPVYGTNVSTTYKTASFKWGESKWVDITDSNFITAFQNGTAKGIGIYTPSGSPYMIFSQSAKLEITYS